MTSKKKSTRESQLFLQGFSSPSEQENFETIDGIIPDKNATDDDVEILLKTYAKKYGQGKKFVILCARAMQKRRALCSKFKKGSQSQSL